MLLAFTGCTEPDNTDLPPKGDEVQLTVAPEALTLYTYQSETLNANLQGAEWSSSDTSIARVDKETGTVTGISEGIATITATKGEKTATCRVSVVDDYSMPVLGLSNRYVAVNQGGEYGVSAFVTIRGERLNDAKYSYTVVGDKDVASVIADDNKSNAIIKGLSYGSTLIKVEAVTDNFTLTSFIDVDVKNVTVWFDVSGVIRNEGEYKVNLYALNDGELKNSVAPVINVYDAETQVSNPEFAWSSSNDSIATVSEEGLIEAVSPGTAFVYAAYGDDRVIFKVNVLYAEKRLADRIDIELGRNETDMSLSSVEIPIPSEINDTIVAVNIQGRNLLISQTDTAFVIDKSRLPSEMGSYDITVQTHNAKYTAEGMICTMVIYTAEDLDSFGNIAKKMSESSFTWDGYFALGNDIIYNDTATDESTWKKYQSFISTTKINSAGGNPFDYANEVGFKGVFDGCGYNIDGFMTDAQSENDRGGFIGILNANGVIKDLSFTNAVHSGLGGFLTSMAGGRIENIFIHASKQYITRASSSPASYRNGFLVGCDSKFMLDINNCIVMVEEYVGSEEDLPYATTLGAFWTDNGSLDNAYAIGGVDRAVYSLNDSGYKPLGIKDVYASYKSVSDFLSADIDLKDFSDKF